ncbi:hypothetical protein DFQ26_007431 [Actinomortierella ambigua]|nr:hypothetical protein DFQ26_007431 [Actinomortierella ambigua]
MGVEGFYSYEKRLAGAPAPVQIQSILNKEHELHVDLVGLFFNIIRRTIKSDLAHPLSTNFPRWLPRPPTAAKEHRFKAAELQIFRLDYSCKVWLADGLHKLGMNVCKCPFEADICIAATFKASESEKSLVSVSGDLDFRINEHISPSFARSMERAHRGHDMNRPLT